MKLANLLEYDKSKVDAEISDTDRHDDIANYIEKYGGYEIGTGNYAIVYDKPNDVNTVIKTGRSLFNSATGFNDAYLNFILNLTNDPRARDNPFFPQIFSVKIYCRGDDSDLNKQCQYIIEMEKLESLESGEGYIKRNEIFDKYRDDPNAHFFQVLNAISKLTNTTPEEYLEYVLKETQDPFIEIVDLWDIMESVIFSYVRGSRRRANKYLQVKITDKKFFEAIKLLSRYKKNSVYDLHNENVMIRRTPYGLQLVITDPFSNMPTD